jgi:hypothetical protein
MVWDRSGSWSHEKYSFFFVEPRPTMKVLSNAWMAARHRAHAKRFKLPFWLISLETFCWLVNGYLTISNLVILTRRLHTLNLPGREFLRNQHAVAGSHSFRLVLIVDLQLKPEYFAKSSAVIHHRCRGKTVSCRYGYVPYSLLIRRRAFNVSAVIR